MKINSGTILIGFFAILCGLVGVHLYREATKPKPVVKQQAPAQPTEPVKSVVPMVSRDLLPGQVITIDDIALVRMTAEQRKKTGLKKAYMTNPDQIIGQRVKIPLKRGDTFDTRNFYPVGMGPGISHKVKPGYRALTIPMTPANALIGFAGPGQMVDVLFHYGNVSQQGFEGRPAKSQLQQMRGTGGMHQASYGNQNSKFRGATSTVAQGVEILAFNQVSTEGASGSTATFENVMVTVAVKPRDAELLRVAMGHGELSLTLRSPSDKSLAVMPMPSTVDDLIHIEEPKVSEMEIFRGNSVSRLQFATNQGGRIKPKKVALPNLKIHVPSGVEQFEFGAPQTEEPPNPQQINTNVSEEPVEQPGLEEGLDPWKLGNNPEQSQEYPGSTVDSDLQIESRYIESTPIYSTQKRTPNVESEPLPLQFERAPQVESESLPSSQSRSLSLQLEPESSYRNPVPNENVEPGLSSKTETFRGAPLISETAIPIQGNQAVPNVPSAEIGSRPSLPGVRFAENPYRKRDPNAENLGMPSSIMSSGRNDYREKFYRRGHSLGNGHRYSGSQRR